MKKPKGLEKCKYKDGKDTTSLNQWLSSTGKSFPIKNMIYFYVKKIDKWFEKEDQMEMFV